MAEYIKRESLFKKVHAFGLTLSDKGARLCVNRVLNFISQAPTVDAVEVIRCGECIHRVEDNVCIHPKKVGGDVLVIEVKPDDFCSYGERRSE